MYMYVWLFSVTLVDLKQFQYILRICTTSATSVARFCVFSGLVFSCNYDRCIHVGYNVRWLLPTFPCSHQAFSVSASCQSWCAASLRWPACVYSCGSWRCATCRSCSSWAASGAKASCTNAPVAIASRSDRSRRSKAASAAAACVIRGTHGTTTTAAYCTELPN